MFRTPEFREENGIRAQIEIENIEFSIGETAYGLPMEHRLLQNPVTNILEN
jgi:hypothetical protein